MGIFLIMGNAGFISSTVVGLGGSSELGFLGFRVLRVTGFEGYGF